MRNIALAPKEHYPVSQTEFLAPTFLAESDFELRSGGAIDISQYEPLLTAEQTEAKIGFPTGALQAVVHLPYKESYFLGEVPEELVGSEQYAAFRAIDRAEVARRRNAVSIYCFKAPEGTGRHSASQEMYYCMGLEQLGQLREQVLYGSPSLPETDDGIVGLTRGQGVRIGRGENNWLPNVGRDYTSLKNSDDYLKEQFSSVSRHQADVWVDEYGDLVVRRSENSYSHYGRAMSVEVGRPLDYGDNE
jgi:hypothetical protein